MITLPLETTVIPDDIPSGATHVYIVGQEVRIYMKDDKLPAELLPADESNNVE